MPSRDKDVSAFQKGHEICIKYHLYLCGGSFTHVKCVPCVCVLEGDRERERKGRKTRIEIGRERGSTLNSALKREE